MSSSANSPAASAAARTRSSSEAVSGGGKNGRPVLVQTAPGAGETPKRAAAEGDDRHTSRTAREPMCFSSHTTSATPSAR